MNSFLVRFLHHLLLVATLGGFTPFHVTLGASLGRFGAEFKTGLGGFALTGHFALAAGFALAVQFDIVIVLMSHFYYKKRLYFFLFFFHYFHHRFFKKSGTKNIWTVLTPQPLFQKKRYQKVFLPVLTPLFLKVAKWQSGKVSGKLEKNEISTISKPVTSQSHVSVSIHSQERKE